MAFCVVESYDTKNLAGALPNRAVLVGDVACIGLPPRPERMGDDGLYSDGEGTAPAAVSARVGGGG